MLRYLVILITPYLVYLLSNASFLMLNFFYKVFSNIKFICKNLTLSCFNKYKNLPSTKILIDRLISGKNLYTGKSFINSTFISNHLTNFQVYP